MTNARARSTVLLGVVSLSEEASLARNWRVAPAGMSSAAEQATRMAASTASAFTADSWCVNAGTLDALGKFLESLCRLKSIANEAKGWHHLRAPITCAEHVNATDATAMRSARDMDACMQPGHRQCVHRVTGKSGHEAQGLETGGHVLGGVCVHRAASTLVAGVERGKQIDDLRAAHLADDNTIGSHAQGLTNQIAEGDNPRAFEIGRPSLKAHDMGMLGAQFA